MIPAMVHPGVYLALAAFLISIGVAGAQQVFPAEKFTTEWWVVTMACGVPGLLLGAYGAWEWVQEKEPLEPDLELDEFVDLWLGFQRRGAASERATAILEGTANAFVAMADMARRSRITVWGRKNCVVPGMVPRGPIPPEQWDHLSVDFLDFLSGRETKEVRAETINARGPGTFFSDIHLNRKQIAKAWPKIGRAKRSS